VVKAEDNQNIVVYDSCHNDIDTHVSSSEIYVSVWVNVFSSFLVCVVFSFGIFYVLQVMSGHWVLVFFAFVVLFGSVFCNGS